LLTSASRRSSSLERLPAELLVKIFNEAGHLDQLALALSSKHLLDVSTLADIKISSCAGKPQDRENMEALLKIVQPLGKTGLPNRTWIVCLDCFRWRPRKQAYWREQVYRLPYRDSWKDVESFWKVAVEEHWENKVAQWKRHSLLQCPECWYLERMERVLYCLEIGRYEAVYLYEPIWTVSHDRNY
jgi:hypothetical protein